MGGTRANSGVAADFTESTQRQTNLNIPGTLESCPAGAARHQAEDSTPTERENVLRFCAHQALELNVFAYHLRAHSHIFRIYALQGRVGDKSEKISSDGPEGDKK